MGNSRQFIAPAIKFWSAFILLNALFFAPLTILFWGEGGDSAENLLQFLFIQRPTFDVFRLNIEWLVLMAAWCALPELRNRPLRIFIWVSYFFTLAYYIYEAIIVAFFFNLPTAYNDYFLARDGLSGLLQHFDFPLAMIVLPLLLLVSAAYLLYEVTADRNLNALSYQSQFLLPILALLGLIIVVFSPTAAASPEGVVSSLSNKIAGNVSRSQLSKSQRDRISQLSLDTSHYDYQHVTLQQKPTIYLIFLESYGDIAYSHPEISERFLQLVAEVDTQLSNDGWHIASKLSWTPVHGGGSWLAYTSFLNGIKIDNEPLFDTLVKNSAETPLPSFPRYLQTQGYQSNRITPMPVDSADEQTFLAELQHFYGFDRWLTLEDMAYTGQRYGWGPAPPDQYTLEFLRREVNAQPHPSINFFLTHNSHAPYGAQPQLVADWQALQDPALADGIALNVTPEFSAENYLNAIDYQLRAVADFIVRESNDDTIFIVAGDHQPPRIAPLDGSPFTPLHIIGKDRDFIDDFLFFEFYEGLHVNKLTHGIRHEGFFSLFMRAFLGNYSDTSYDDLPTYLPDGYDLNSAAE